jgi:hypothetical protein
MLVNGVGFNPPVESPITAFGIINPRCTFRNLDDDEFTFEQKNNILLGLFFQYGTKIQLNKYVNGVKTVWFVGTISKITVVGNAKEEIVRYVVSGPWFQYKTTMWQVAAQCYVPTSQTCTLTSEKVTKVVLFQDPAVGGSITTGQQITNIVTYGLSLGIAVGPGFAPTGINVPFEETRDLTLAAAIRRCMQWSPKGATWFNYSTGSVVFNAGDVGDGTLSAVTLDLALENLIVAFDLNPRYDLVPVGVRFNYIGTAECNILIPNGCVDPSTGILNTGAAKLSQGPVQVQTVTQDNGGQNVDATPGGLIGTIDLTQLSGTTSENPPIGLANAYWASLLAPQYDGSITTHEFECSGTLRPGKMLNLANGQSPWLTMNTLIQEVTENLYTGETTARLGTPQHLAPQTFAYLVNMTARRPLVTSGFAAVNTPGPGGNSCPQGISPETQKLLSKVAGSGSSVAAAIGPAGLGGQLGICGIGVCQGGNLTTINVYCPPQSD